VIPMDDQAAAIYSLERAQDAAAYVAARLQDDRLGQAALVRTIGSPADLVHGLTRLAEQLAVELGRATDRSPAEVCASVCALAALGIEARKGGHPSAGSPPPG